MAPLAELLSDRPAVLVASAVALILAVSLYVIWLWPKPIAGFPHNPITSILGDIPEITQVIKSGKSASDYYPMLVKRHGPVVQMFIGREMFLIVGDRNEAERLLLKSKNVDMPPIQFLMFAPIMPNGLMGMPNNDVWKHHRRVLGPSMNQRYLSRMAIHVSETANLLAKLWDDKIKIAQGGAWSADIDVGLAILDSIATITVGCTLGSVETVLRSPFNSFFEPSDPRSFASDNPRLMYDAVRNITHKTSWGMKLPFPSITYPIFVRCSPSWRKDSTMLRSYLMKKITEARQRETNLMQSGGLMTDADCVLDMLIQQEVREGPDALSTEELLDELMVYFIAGHESTAMSVLWLLKYLPKDPVIQRRLHKELCHVFGNDGEIDPAMWADVLGDTKQLPILEAVINETLRHAKVVGATVRCLLDDEVIMGRHVPKGTNLMLPLGWFGNWESDWGPDVHEWRPSRWLRPDGSFDRNAGPDGYPFGMGHRSCFGQKLAMLQLRILVATLTRSFFFKPVPPELDSWDAVLVVTKQPKMGYVSLERWGSESKADAVTI